MNLFTNDITDYYMYAYTGINLCIAFLGCFFALYAFHTFTKGNHFREWKEFEPLDAPIPRAATNRNYDAHVALIQGRLQIMFQDLYAEHSRIMCGDWFIECVALEYFDHEKCNHRVGSLAQQIMDITPKSHKWEKLLKSTRAAIEFISKSKS